MSSYSLVPLLLVLLVSLSVHAIHHDTTEHHSSTSWYTYSLKQLSQQVWDKTHLTVDRVGEVAQLQWNLLKVKLPEWKADMHSRVDENLSLWRERAPQVKKLASEGYSELVYSLGEKINLMERNVLMSWEGIAGYVGEMADKLGNDIDNDKKGKGEQESSSSSSSSDTSLTDSFKEEVLRLKDFLSSYL